jgi:hypothetical protein
MYGGVRRFFFGGPSVAFDNPLLVDKRPLLHGVFGLKTEEGPQTTTCFGFLDLAASASAFAICPVHVCFWVSLSPSIQQLTNYLQVPPHLENPMQAIRVRQELQSCLSAHFIALLCTPACSL